MFFFIGLGTLSFMRMGVSQLPDVDFPTVNVRVNWEGAAPEVIELDVVDPIESALVSVEGVEGISSSSRRGSANITVEFNLDKDIDVAVQEVQTKLSQVQRQLPEDIDPPSVSKTNPEDQPIMWLSFSSSEMSRKEIMAYVRDHVRDQFLSVSGVADIFLGGYIEPNLRIWADQKKLERFDMSVVDIINAVDTEHVELPSGIYTLKNQELSVRTLGEAKSVQDFSDIHLLRRGGGTNYVPIKISDLASVEDGLDDIKRISRVNGKSAVGLGIRKIRGSNAVEVGDAVKAKMQEIKDNLPHGSEIGINFDSTTFIKDSIHELNLTLVLSALLTALVCWLFLGSLSSTFNVVLSIPTAIIGAFIAMNFMGFTLNTFTLLALTLATGLVVDDNIMILENIVRHKGMGKKGKKAALEGTEEISFAALAASVAIIAIFMPVGFMDGVIGKFFYQFALTLTFTIAFSYIDAISLTPMRSSRFMSDKELKGPKLIEDTVQKLAKGYKRFLHFVLNWRFLTIFASIAFFVLSLLIAKILPKEFAPSQDQGNLMLRINTQEGSSLDFTDSKVKELEEILAKAPEVSRYYIAVGGFGGNESNSAVAFLTLLPFDQRPVDSNLNKRPSHMEFAQKIRDQFKDKVKGARLSVRDLSQGGFGGRGRGYPVEFGLRGDNWDELAKYADLMAQEMEKTGLMTDVDRNFKGNVPELHIKPIRQKALNRGVSIRDIGQVIRATVSGVVVGKFSKDGRRYDIRLKLREDQAVDIASIKKLTVRNNRGELIPLAEVADIEMSEGLLASYREDRGRELSMYANLTPGASQAKALELCKEIAKKVLPPKYTYVESGASKTLRDSFNGLVVVMGVGLLISYMILAAQFNSFFQPFVIMIPLPFALSGALMGLWLFGQSINTFSLIGIVLLMGLVKKNSIILVDYTNQLRRENKLSIKEALIEACPIRLRPIIMTSVSTIVGALPTVILAGPGSETRIPLGITIAAGTLVSTFLTLFVVPALYSLISREGKDGLEEDLRA